MDGTLADVRVLGDAGLPLRLGLRWRPWLAAVFPLDDGPLPWVVDPAPVRPVQTLAEVVECWGPPAFTLTERPSVSPPRLQLQTTTACRQACSFCPHPGPQAEVHTMEEALFTSILEAVSPHEPASIELYLHAEPLLDPRLPHLSRLAHQACPGATLAVVCHEREAREEVLSPLAGTLGAVHVSLDPLRMDWIPRVRRLARLRVRLLDQGTDLGATVLSNLVPAGGVGPLRRACREHHLPLEAFRATHRAGLLHHPDLGPPRGCTLPFHTAHVRWDGTLLACCEDWTHSLVLGDARDLLAAWQGPRARRLRRSLLAGAHCATCVKCLSMPATSRSGPFGTDPGTSGSPETS